MAGSRSETRADSSCGLVLGVKIFDLDLRFQISLVKQPNKSNSVGSGHVSHRGAPSFDNHFDHSFILFKNVELRLALRNACVCGHVIHLTWLINLLTSCDMLALGVGFRNHSQFPGAWMCGLNCTSFLVAYMAGLEFVFGGP